MKRIAVVPAIALTAHAISGDRERFLAAGYAIRSCLDAKKA